MRYGSKYQVFPNCDYAVSPFRQTPGRPELTFSNPQNLSLPLSREGPRGTSIRYFSSGVICRALGSFFAGEEPADGLDVPCERGKCQTLYTTQASRFNTRIEKAVHEGLFKRRLKGILTPPERIRLKKEDILIVGLKTTIVWAGGGCWTSGVKVKDEALYVDGGT